MMTLALDTRQRAMLQEMGIHIWLPSPAPPVPVAKPVVKPPISFAPEPEPAPVEALPAHIDFVDFADVAIENRQADWFILGDSPHTPESQLGAVFVDQSGILLDNILKAVGASRTGQGRQGAYVSLAGLYRSSDSGTPSAQELQQCRAFVQREIAAVQPRIIMAIGKFAIQLVLQEHPHQTELPLDKQRGTVYSYQGIPVVLSYSPKVLLRASANKAKAWADWCLALEVLNPI